MATHLPDDMAIQPVADVCASFAGALESDPVTQDLATTWESLAAKGDAMAGQRRTLLRNLGRARAQLAVADGLWDPEVAAFGRDIVDQSGGKRDQAPYTRFFKSVSPSAAQKFGVDREVDQGQDWIAELARDPNDPLAVKWSPRLSKVTEKLATASNSRSNALKAVALHDTAEELFLDDINREIDMLEGELMKRFPGQPKRVASFLEATRPRKKRSRSTGGDDGESNGDEG